VQPEKYDCVGPSFAVVIGNCASAWDRGAWNDETMKSTRKLISLLAALTLAGCAYFGGEEDGAYSHASAERVFVVGFSDIQQIYIDEPVMHDLVVAGLKGLRKIEPDLDVEYEKANLRLLIGNKTVVTTRVAKAGDAAAWAKAIVRMLDEMREISKPLGAATSEDIYQAVFAGAVRKLDPYTRYASAAKARENRAKRGGFGGIGLIIEAHEDGARIKAVSRGKPGDKAGVVVGDRIVAIGEVALTGYTLRQVVRLLRGPVGTEVALTLRRGEKGEPFVVTLTRARIINNTVFYARRGDVGYIRVSGFNQATSKRVLSAVQRARKDVGKNIRGLIIDMRGNPGGLLDQAVAMADLFLRSGQIISTRGRHPNSLQLFDAKGSDVFEGLPIAVLVDGASASAAEIVASALQDQGRAVIVGTRSFGKGTVQTVLRLPNDGELVLTWARIHAPSGYVLHRLGVLPTVCTSNAEDATSALDTLIGKAADILRRNLSARRAADHQDKSDQESIKALCPWQPREDKDFDLEVAEKLLGKRDLYDKALAYARPEAGS